MNSGRFTDHSGTITLGGTSQTAIAENIARRGLLIHNPADASETLFVNIDAAASTTAKNSIELTAGGTLTLDENLCGVGPITVNAVTTAHAFIAKEVN